MRLGFPQLLLASCAVHLVVITGLALPHVHSAVPRDATTAASNADSTSLILLRSVETPDFHQIGSMRSQLSSNPYAPSVSTTPPSPGQSLAEKQISSLTPPPSFALEANPNVYIRSLPPEAVLAPNPAPHLNGKDGVVFILDVSGSMYEPFAGSNRLAFARQTLASYIRALKNGTPFAITVYAENALNSGPLVAASDATRNAAIRFIMRDINCGGGTNLPAGLAAAAQLQSGSLVLVSDGDLNIAQYALKAQVARILGEKGECPALSIIGICPRPNKQDGHLLESLADEQGGTYRPEQFDGTELVTTSGVKAEIDTP